MSDANHIYRLERGSRGQRGVTDPSSELISASIRVPQRGILWHARPGKMGSVAQTWHAKSLLYGVYPQLSLYLAVYVAWQSATRVSRRRPPFGTLRAAHL